jgi:selenoprotein W-related protein
LAAAISNELGFESELVKGENGIFDVEVDNKIIFSKKQAGRFPDKKEIIKLLRR